MNLDIENFISLKLSNTLNTMRKVFNKAISEYGISSEQYLVLKLINEKKLTPTNIADFLNKDKAAVTRFINSLEKKDLIKKENFTDKRSYKIIITKKGKDILSKIDDIALEFRKKIEKNISQEELQCLFDVLEKIEKTMKD
jgi:DNA-binding MarR family transcriptional regulator